MAVTHSNNQNFEKPFSEGQELYQDIEIPQFAVGDRIIWAPGGVLHPKTSEKSSFGIGIIDRIVNYTNPINKNEHLLAFVYFCQWVPGSIEVTWPDGDQYYRLLVQVSDLRPFNEIRKPPPPPSTIHIELSTEDLPNSSDLLPELSTEPIPNPSDSQQVLLRTCNLSSTSKAFHPNIPENSTIFNMHNQRLVKGVVAQFVITANGELYMEADFELEVYPDELLHNETCEYDDSCEHSIAIRLANLKPQFWDSEFKLLINHKRVNFEDLFVKMGASSPPVVEEESTKPQIHLMRLRQPTSPKEVPAVHTQNSTGSRNNIIVNQPQNVPIINRNGIRSSLIYHEVKLRAKKSKKTSPSISETIYETSDTPPIQVKQTNKSKPKNFAINSMKPINQNIKTQTLYVGEYYNDFSEAINKPLVAPAHQFNGPPTSYNVPKIPNTSLPTTKAFPFPSGTAPPISPTPMKVASSKHTLPKPPPPPPPPLLPHTVKNHITSPPPLPNLDRSELMLQIKMGKPLRHVTTNDRSGSLRSRAVANKSRQQMNQSQNGNFASILMGALANRRAMIERSEEDEMGSDTDNSNADQDEAWD